MGPWLIKTMRRKWKYNKDIEQHYIEVDESGELTKKYVQTKEEEETTGSDQPVAFKVLSLDDPAAIERGSEGDAIADPFNRDAKPSADEEKQDRSVTSFSKWSVGSQCGLKKSTYHIIHIFWGVVATLYPTPSQENGVLLAKSMEALLAKSAKLRDVESKLIEAGNPRQNQFVKPSKNMIFFSKFNDIKMLNLHCATLPISASMVKSTYESMDNHYDTLATSLARFRAATNPGPQLLRFIQHF